MQIKRGDTIVEVTFAIAVFALVAIISISIMNSGISTAQASLELTMARNEIDAQAEALRFIHNSFLSEREFPVSEQQYRNLWRMLSRDASSMMDPGRAILPNQLPPLTVEQCSTVYDVNVPNNIFADKAFVVNTRLVDPTADVSRVIVASAAAGNGPRFIETPMYPRIIFSTAGHVYDTGDTSATDLVEKEGEQETGVDTNFTAVARAEGIWVISVRDAHGLPNLTDHPNPSPDTLAATVPEFFDFHIRTCWYAPGRSYPTTIGTIIRLYNPEFIEGAR